MSNSYLEQVNSLFSELSSTKEKLLSIFAGYSPEQQNFKYRADKWSALQILHHIIKSEQLTVLSVKRSLIKSKLPKMSLVNKLNSKILNIALKMPFKYPAPESVRNVPEIIDINELSERWEKIRSEFKIVIDEFPPDKLYDVVFVHPYAGEQNLLSTLEFLLNHLDRHFNQITSILEMTKK